MAEGLVLKDIIDMVLRNKSIILSQLTKDDKSYGVPQRRLTGDSHFVEDVVLSSDCYDALSGNWDGELRLRDLATGDSTRRFVGHTKDVLSVAFSVGNRQIVSVSGDRTIKLWNSLGECKYTISEQGDGYKDWISCVRFSPNMPTIVSGSWDHTLKVWNLQNCKLRNSLAGYLNTVAVSPDCSLCASCGKDGVILLWDLTEGKKLYSLKAGSIIHSLCFSPNRYWLCAATENSIKIWDLESKSVVEDLQLMEMNASESESFENLRMKLNQTLSLVKELKWELYNAKKGEAQALNNASVLEKQLEIQNSRIEIFVSLETELEQSKSNVKLLEQLVGELQEGDKANEEDYRQSMLELSSAREQFKVNESQYAEIEAKLGEELKNIKAETQALHGILMYREENLRVVKKLLKLKIKEAEELNLENSLNQKEPEFTDKLKKLESDLMDKETKLQSVTSEKDSVRIEMEKMQSEKNLVIEEELAAQVTKTELEAELRRLEDHCDQWRKAVASRFSGGNNNNSNARYVERTGSLDSLLRRNVNMSLFMDETDANISPLKKKKKKNGSVLKMLGGFMKISQK